MFSKTNSAKQNKGNDSVEYYSLAVTALTIDLFIIIAIRWIIIRLLQLFARQRFRKSIVGMRIWKMNFSLELNEQWEVDSMGDSLTMTMIDGKSRSSDSIEIVQGKENG